MSVLNQKEITIIKRNNKKDTFQPEKIAVAIKKGFDSVKDPNETAQDSHLVFTKVIEQIEEIASYNPNIKIEDIQDIIEKQLIKNGFSDVYESFSSYRNRRNESRHIFISKQIGRASCRERV